MILLQGLLVTAGAQTYSVSGTVSPAASGVGTTLTLSGGVPTLVSTAQGSSPTGNTSGTVSFTTNGVAGDAIVLFLRFGGTTVTSVTDNQSGGSNTYTSIVGPTQWGVAPNSTDRDVQIYVAKNIKGGTKLTITVKLAAASTHDLYLVALEYSGVDPNNPVNASAVATGTVTSGGGTANGTPAPTVSLNTTVANAKLVATSWDSNESYLSTSGGTGFTTNVAAGINSISGGTGWSNLTEDATGVQPGSYTATTNTARAVTDWAIEMVALTPAASLTTATADANGNFTFNGLANGVYTVTPSQTGLTFTPATQTVTVNSANVTGVNFTALYQISGTITGGAGDTVSLSGTSSATTTANASGSFTFVGLTSGNYTITPSGSGVTFAPVSETVTLNSADVSGVNFTAIVPTYSISGTISPAASASGALVTLGGAANQTETVDASGNFRFDNLLSGNYTVTPSQAGLIFNPASINVTVNGAPVTGVNFTAQASAISLDATVFKDQNTANTSVAATGLTTKSGNELLLAFVGADGSSSGTNVTVSSISGGGLTWTLVNRTNTQRGTAEIWRAFATSTISNVTVTANLSQKVVSSMTIMTFTGVNTSGTGGSGAIGATGTGNASTGAPTASLTTKQANSWVVGVGNDWDNAIGRTVGPNQTLVHQDLPSIGDTYWVQRVTTLAGAGAVVTVNDTAPTTDRYNLSTVEILPAALGSAPAVSLSTTDVNFGDQPIVTTSAVQAVTLTNTGTAALTITSIAATGDFGQTNTCGTSLATNGTCSINVLFTPTAEGARTGTVTITDNAPGGPHIVNLIGNGTTAGVTLSTTSLTFASQQLGTSSAVQTFTMYNTGNGTLFITSIGSTGTNAADFQQTNNCGVSLAVGGSCVISVTFSPVGPGARSASISIVDNASTGSTQTVALSGTGTGPFVSQSALSLTYASQLLGTASAAQTVTLTNTGNQALAIAGVAVTGTNSTDFTDTTTCGASLAANASCTVSVTFKPTAPGARAAAVTVTDSAIGSPHTITLTGTGTGPFVNFSSPTLTFASQPYGTTSTAQSITLTNSGDQALSVTSVTISGAAAADYLQTNTCGTSVAANGGTCTISVTFTPSLPGTRAATVGVADNAIGTPQTFALTGTGTGPFASPSPTTLTFSAQALNTTSAAKTVTLTNAGDQPLPITGISITGTNNSEFAQTNNCVSPLGASLSCTINVTFTPAAPGARSAAVSITDGAVGSPQSIALTGTGNGASVSLSVASLTFASQQLGTSSTAQSVTLTNTGNQALSVTGITITGTNNTDFTQTNTCGSSVAANGTCTINVTFKPTGPNTRTASVSIADNAAGSPQTIGLTGTGTGPFVNLSAPTLTFSAQPFGTTSTAQTVTLTNNGNQALSITTIGVTGAASTDYAETNTCGASVAANGGTCTISVTFTPSVPGTRSATVSISDNAIGTPHTFGLTGAGTGAFVSLSSNALTFNPQLLNTTSAAQTVTLTNSGDQALSIASIVPGGTNSSDFTVTTTCGASVSAGGVCGITATFTPTATGSRTASVTITDSAVGSPQVIGLSGTGTTTFSISGTISPAATGAGATVSLTGSATASTTADASGNYTFNGLLNGTYTVTPSKAGTTFAPPNQLITINNAAATGINFTATATPIALDATVSKDQGTASTTVAATGLTTKSTNELLLALISTDGPATGANTTVNSISGGGLTWTLVVRTNTQLGTAEIWRAFATTTLSNVTVTATLSKSNTSSMTVMSFSGVNTSGTGGSGAIGATGSGNAASGAPTASLVATQSGSWVIGVGNDWDNATSRTLGANQTLVHQYLSPNGDTYWVQRVSTTSTAGATVTVNDTAPTSDRYNLSIVEILP